MGLMRSIAMFFMSAGTKTKAEAESRAWMAPCRNCGAAVSVWDIGGIRYGAAGRKTTLARCPRCKKVGPFTFTKTK